MKKNEYYPQFYPYWFRIADDLPKDAQPVIGVETGYTYNKTAIIAAVIKDDTVFLKEVFTGKKSTGDVVKMIELFTDRKVLMKTVDPRLLEELENAGVKVIGLDIIGESMYKEALKELGKYTVCVTKDSTGLIEELKNCKEDDFYNAAMNAVLRILMFASSPKTAPEQKPEPSIEKVKISKDDFDELYRDLYQTKRSISGLKEERDCLFMLNGYSEFPDKYSEPSRDRDFRKYTFDLYACSRLPEYLTEALTRATVDMASEYAKKRMSEIDAEIGSIENSIEIEIKQS